MSARRAVPPFKTNLDASAVRLIVLPEVKPSPGFTSRRIARYSYHAFITDRDGETLTNCDG